MKVSIITVTYNAEEYLAECIRSVAEQDYLDIEHIIIDGKSTDKTLDIIKGFDGKITKWISETDRGMYDAINKGIQLSSGDIIGILNSDDLLAGKSVVSAIVASFQGQAVDAVYGDLVYVQKNNINKVVRLWKGFSYKRYRFQYGWMPAHPTFYVRRDRIDNFGGYENHYYTAADYEFMARYLYVHHVSAFYLPMLIVKMRTGGQSNVTLKSRLRANRRDYLAMKNNKIPFPFLVSILKPVIKLHQYYYSLFHKVD